MLGEVLGVGWHWRRSDDKMLEVLSEIGVGGGAVTQVAQRHEMARYQIYGWRGNLNGKGL